MTDQNGPVYDPNPNTSYDDDFAIGAAAGAGDAGLTPEMENEKPAGGAPLRGLAMILTAVAVVLIAWGVFSFVGADGDDDGSDGDSGTVAGEQDGTNGSDGSGADSDDANRDGDGTSGSDSDSADSDSADSADSADSDTGDADDTNRDGDGGTDGNSDGSGANIDRGETAVTVLNNGPNNGGPIATDAADRLREDNWGNIGVGNLQGRVTGVSEETRVYYPEGNAQAQAAAEQIGRDLGIPVASGNNDYYDRFGEADVRNGPDATNVVIVLTGPLA